MAAISPFLSAPHTEDEYDNLSAFLDKLIDDVGNDESHPLAVLMDTVGTLIEAYDKEHFPFSEDDPIDVLKHLMKNIILHKVIYRNWVVKELYLKFYQGKEFKCSPNQTSRQTLSYITVDLFVKSAAQRIISADKQDRRIY